MVVQQSNHAIWIYVLTNKELVVSEISKNVLDLFCSTCHKRFYYFWSLFFNFSFDWFNVIFDVLPVGFLCEVSFLQMIVQDNINTSNNCFLYSYPQAFSKAFQSMLESSMLPAVLPTIFLTPPPDRTGPPSPTSGRCWGTSHHGWWGLGRWTWVEWKKRSVALA